MRRVVLDVWSVMRHWYALLAGVIGSAVFPALAWLKPALAQQAQQRIEQIAGSLLSPHVYLWCAAALALGGFVVASFLAWNDEHKSTVELAALKRSAPHIVAIGMPVSPVRVTTPGPEGGSIHAIRSCHPRQV